MNISSIYIYPVKSCKGIKVDSWKINNYGFKFDRFWMIVDDQNHAITQREHSKLALVSPTIHENDDDDNGGSVILTNPENDQELKLPLLPNKGNGIKLSVTICDEIIMAYDCGKESSKWISDYLGFEAKIVHKSIEDLRIIEKNLPPKNELLKQPETAFSDGYPFLIISEESLSDLNNRLSLPVTFRNFRPNIVIKGCNKPFEEDTWKKIIVGEDADDNLFFVVARSTRCVMTTVNPETGIKEGLDPLKTLQSYRRVDPGAKYKACFGMNVIHNKSGMTLNVGDQIKVIATGEHIREK
ncbi:MOSC-domain-containing protein [Rhizophagus irregularis]|uniref:MOSC-domain-containing protein n=2 Tax=Rhizophagus irregularis TaxID=588596 RepID=A0A2I1GX44_9GLOM|nr:MOSC-domain-containing protein [Rhizophagus irregularis]